MNEKTKKFLTDARNKAEDAIVKAKAFIEKHPVACTIGGIAASSVVAGVIGKKIGFKDGFDAMKQRADEWIFNDQPKDEFYCNIGDDSKFRDTAVVRNLMRGASAMHLEEGDSVAVFRTANGLFVDTCLDNNGGEYVEGITNRLVNEISIAPVLDCTGK